MLPEVLPAKKLHWDKPEYRVHQEPYIRPLESERCESKSHAFIPNIITADELVKKEFPDIRWAVEGIVPEGVTLLAGAPKIGKSWLCLNLGAAVAKGGKAFGKIQCEQGSVIYLALEDNERRMKRRLVAMGYSSAPQNLSLTFKWPRNDVGCIEHLNAWLTENENPRLVLIDTLAKIRPAKDGKKDAYSTDYEALEPLLPLASKHGVAIVVIHHTRKMSSEDPLEMISGTLGLTGGVDGAIVLSRVRGKPECTMFVTGRDIEDETERVLTFDQPSAQWVLTDQSPLIARLSDKQREVLDCIQKLPFPSAADIAKSMYPSNGMENLGSVKRVIQHLRERGLIENTGKGYQISEKVNHE